MIKSIIISITFVIFLCFTLSFADDQFGSMWKQEGTVVYPADDVDSVSFDGITTINLTNIRVSGFPTTTMANLHYNSTSVYQNMSTENIWYTNTDWTAKTVFGNISASVSAGTITIGENGDYLILLDNSIRASSGVLITQGLDKDGSIVDSFSREMTKGPDRLPTFRSISSDGGDATYDTYSTLSYLYYADKDIVRFQEASAGSTGCFYAQIHYEEVDIPFLLVLNNTMYVGGVGHYGDVQAYDYNSSSWINLRSATSDFEDVGTEEDYKKQNTRWAFPTNRSDFVSGGKVMIRIVHNDAVCNSGHVFVIDETYIIDRVNSIPFPSHHEVTLSTGDEIGVSFKTDEANTDFIKDHIDLTVIRIGE